MTPVPVTRSTASDSTVRQVGVIDVGSSAIRMDIAEIGPGGAIRILESLQRPVKLGKDTYADGRLEGASIEACVGIIRDFRHVLHEYGIDSPLQIEAVATSSVREADNRDAFLDRLYIATGIDVKLLEDAEVEHLIHLALQDLVRQEPGLQGADLLVLEVGGGMTRVLLVQGGHVTFSSAFRLGSLRMRETLETYQRPAEQLPAILDEHLQRTLLQMRQAVPTDRVPVVVALAGDAESAMNRLLPGYRERRMARLSLEGPSLAESIVSLPADELMVRFQLPSQEAETAGHALFTYDRIGRAFQAREVVVTDRSLRRGLLLRLAGNVAGVDQMSDQMAFSAAALARKYHTDEKHANHVADLSRQLFRELQAEHQLPPRCAALLQTAAILHDIGAFVGVASHHKHSQYLIQNSEIFSLTKQDTTLVALMARYHRRALPLPSHSEYMALDRESRIIVLKLAALLRIADALDRSHTQKYRNLSFSRESPDFVITAPEVDDLTLERAALRDKGALFVAVYGLNVVLRHAPVFRGSVSYE
jgi:exopolyphosphatase/guanosine-5'-triphosphate,3'-diphosphate pyrophosphatase